jgi:hypothetical protein
MRNAAEVIEKHMQAAADDFGMRYVLSQAKQKKVYIKSNESPN